jgi:hypothetical protein
VRVENIVWHYVDDVGINFFQFVKNRCRHKIPFWALPFSTGKSENPSADFTDYADLIL